MARIALHPIILINYIPRMVGYFLLCIVVIVTLQSQDRQVSNTVIFFIVLQAIIWPNGMFLLSAKSKNPKKLEIISLLIDSVLLGLWVPFLHFSLLPSLAFIMCPSISNCCLGGLRFIARSLASNAVGILIGVLLFGVKVSYVSTTAISLASMSGLFFYACIVGYMTFIRGKVTKDIRKELKDVNAEKDYLIHEIKSSKEALEESFLELQRSKDRLVQSEKMVGIGQLVGGISHEINTPAAAISAAAHEISVDSLALLESMLTMIPKMPSTLQMAYFDACKMTLNVPDEYTTSEIRRNSSEIDDYLKKNGLSAERMQIKNLASIGFRAENMETFIPFFESELKSDILNSIYRLGMIHIHTRDIKIAIKKVLQLVTALRVFSRTDEGHMVSTNLQESIENTLMIVKNKLSRGISVIKAFDHVPEAECIPERLNQVWLNIINNAIEAIKENGKIMIRIAQQDAEHVRIEFEDNGCGIQPEVFPRIFEAYYSTKPRGEGAGLGLYISQEIIHNHNGTISVDSGEYGTTVQIILPLKQ